MCKHLEGEYWSHHFSRVYSPEIDSLRVAILDRMLPSLPDAEREATIAENKSWDDAMRAPWDEGADLGNIADAAQECGIRHYERCRAMKQTAINMATVMLWHLLEQQMLHFHRRQALLPEEESLFVGDPHKYCKLNSVEQLQTRLADAGYPLQGLASWSKVDELRLVANTVKHGPGSSAEKLLSKRPDLFSSLPEHLSQSFGPLRHDSAERPAAGEDLYLQESDLRSYFNSAVQFWTDLGVLIREESA